MRTKFIAILIIACFSLNVYSQKNDRTNELSGTSYFKAVQMGCGGCARRVKQTLTAVEGIDSVSVDMSTKSVMVMYNKEKVDIERIKDAFATLKYAAQLYYPEKSQINYVSFMAEQMTDDKDASKLKCDLVQENGVKDVTVCKETKAISIAYDSQVTDVNKLIAGFKKMDYNVTECYIRK